MSIHASEVLNLHNISHADIDFLDVTLSPDTALFIDPCLIANLSTPWAIQANRTIQSFFDCFFSLYRCNAPDSEKLALFQHCHEINAPRLGYGNGQNGKAKTPQGMLDTFKKVPTLIRSGIHLSTVSDLPVFVKNFAEDCLSDMLTNILLKDLMAFTVTQCQKYNVDTVPAPSGLFYWSFEDTCWSEYSGECLIHDGKILLLVPKSIVRFRYYFTADQYFRSIIITRLYEQSAWLDSDGRIKHVPKSSLRKQLQNGTNTLDSIIRLTADDPTYLSEYHQKLPFSYLGKSMSDTELDSFLYR